MQGAHRHSVPKLALWSLALALWLVVGRSSFAFGWSLIDAKIRHDFPQVKAIAPAKLAAWLEDPAQPKPVLLDVRTRAEYDVSHLAGAQHVEPDAPASAISAPKDRPIVTYCSVGYRSGGFAQRLQAAGYIHVQNLDGSIFHWANEGRPLYRDSVRVEKVHPYNRTWGLLLQKQRRAEMAAFKP